MGRIISSYIFPHPPIIVPDVGKGGELDAMNTVNAAIKASKEIKNLRPTTIVLTTPHAPFFEDHVYISDDKVLKGDFGRFGSRGVSLSFDNNLSLVERIISYAWNEGISSGGIDRAVAARYGMSNKLDHGALVPLYYITREYSDFKLVHISVADLGREELYRFGMCIKKAIEDTDEEVIFVASGDLSHKLTHDAPYGYSEHGKQFDDLVIKSIRENNVDVLLDIKEDICESAAECGLRSFVIMYGALDGYKTKPEVYSYEGPFGVGYSVAKISVVREESGNG